MLAIGLAAALVASVLFNVGIALQGIEARSAPPSLGHRASLLMLLLRRRRWLLGWLLGIVGIGPQVLALAEAPFVLVQPALAVGLLVLLFLGVRMFHEPVGPAEVFGVIAIIGGIGLITWGAPGRTEAARSVYAAIAVTGALCLIGVLPLIVKGTRFDSGMLAIVGSGSGFGASNIATKLMADDVGGGRYGAAAGWALVAVAIGIVATLTGMTAFQRRRATTVVPVTPRCRPSSRSCSSRSSFGSTGARRRTGVRRSSQGLLLALIGTVLVSRTPAVGKLAAGPARRKPN